MNQLTEIAMKTNRKFDSKVLDLEAFPLIVGEQQVAQFKFYLNGALHDGLRYKNDLYRFVKEFRVDERLIAYQFACELILEGIPIIVSVSEHRYGVWVNLRNPLAGVG
jgi:hypothetical protein